MVYLDNGATSQFKPKCVIDALLFDIAHSANGGRSAHSESIKKDLIMQQCREYLKKVLGADDGYEVIFTKSCTEALNLVILGGIENKSGVLTTSNEHNSVLRPLAKLEKDGKISLDISQSDNFGNLDYKDIGERAIGKKYIIATSASNVTGAVSDLYEIGKIAKQNNAVFIVDGAQGVPIVDINVKEQNISALACPAHKGLHAIQGVGFLIVKKDMRIEPLIYGGTGQSSNDLLPECIKPESYEAGTQFSGGISALYQGAKWSYDNLQSTRNNLIRISKNLKYVLKSIGATVYTQDVRCGIVSFNVRDVDSGIIADELNENGICVRAGLHCAPLVHKRFGTQKQGAVRVSVGVDTTQKDVAIFASAMERICKKYAP